MQAHFGRSKDAAKKSKTSAEQFGCDYYSAGLSGPFNGINDEDSDEWKAMLKKSVPPTKELSLSGSCTYSSSYWGCDWDWDTSYTIVSSGSLDFSLDSTADFDFSMDIDACDISADIGGSVYLTVSVGSYDYTYDIWSSPSLSADSTQITLDMSLSVFTFGVTFNNEVYDSSSSETSCCFNFWLMTLRPGYDIEVWGWSLYSGEYSWTYGSVQLGLSTGSNDYCYDYTPSRKLQENLQIALAASK